jgi:hypothetical protein
MPTNPTPPSPPPSPDKPPTNPGEAIATLVRHPVLTALVLLFLGFLAFTIDFFKEEIKAEMQRWRSNREQLPSQTLTAGMEKGIASYQLPGQPPPQPSPEPFLSLNPEEIVRNHYALIQRCIDGDLPREQASIHLRNPADDRTLPPGPTNPCEEYRIIRLQEPPAPQVEVNGDTAFVSACTLWVKTGQSQRQVTPEWRTLTLQREPTTQQWWITDTGEKQRDC